jgi:hypothetical protein
MHDADNQIIETTMKRPIAFMLVVTGLFAASATLIACFIFELLRHDKSVASDFLGLVGWGGYMMYVAVGLLKLKSRSRMAAIWLFCIFGFMSGMVALMSLSQHLQADFLGYEVTRPIQSGVCLSIFAFSILAVWVLTRRGIRDLFAPSPAVTI